jgi:hypothetical protein
MLRRIAKMHSPTSFLIASSAMKPLFYLLVGIFALAIATTASSQPKSCAAGSEAPLPQAKAADLWNLSVEQARAAAQEHLRRQESNYNKCLDTWVGKDVNELASVWGAPEKIAKMPTSDLIYVWLAKVEDRECRTSIFTAKNKIVKWQWSGNACRRANPP